MASLSGLHLRSRLQGRLLRPRLRRVRLVVCDVDGVLTDGGLHYDEAGRVVKRFVLEQAWHWELLSYFASMLQKSSNL
ncbi:MAG: hypothetical protein KFB97_11350 [Cyanobium sp. M30B3]|nr:MAG: hypothetical protein KFB97_11350 [Cyanobium sp. M30B3]